MLFRTLTVIERNSLHEFYGSLPAEDRCARFCGVISDNALQNYLNTLNFSKTEVVGLFSSEGVLEGVLELAINQAEAELAVAISPRVKGQGYGRKLFERGVHLAKIRGVTRLKIHTLATNRPMRRIAEHYRMTTVLEAGEIEGFLALSPPSVLERVTWVFEDLQTQQTFYLVKAIQKAGNIWSAP